MKQNLRNLMRSLPTNLWLLLLILFSAQLRAQTVGEEFTYEGIRYTILTLPADGNPGTVTTKVGERDPEDWSMREPCGNPDATGDLVIPTSVEFGQSEFTVTEIGEYGFSGTEITSVHFPETVTTIGNRAFVYCKNLTEINLLPTITTIGTSVFESCTSLTKVEIPHGFTAIAEWMFYSCTNLTEVKLPSTLTTLDEHSFANCSSLASIQLPENFKELRGWSLQGTAIETIELPAGLTYLGQSAFEWCEHLTSIDIPDGVTELFGWTFQYCYALERVKLPANIPAIGKTEFRLCKSLTTIEIPQSVKSIGSWAFSGCSSLTSINIPDGVTVIDTRTFENCTSLTSISLPEGITTIGYAAFENCTALEAITIPSTVTSLSEYIFNNCTGLKSVVYLSDEPAVGNANIFTNVSPMFYMLKASKDKYDAIEPWKSRSETDKTYCYLNQSWETASLDYKGTKNLTTFTFVLPPHDGEPKFVWTSSNPDVVGVSNIASDYRSCTITGYTGGTADVEVAYEPHPILSATCKVTVAPHTPAVGDEFPFNGVWYVILTLPEGDNPGTVKTKDGDMWKGTSPNTGLSGEVIIPESVPFGGETFNVTELGEASFAGLGITSVTIPPTIEDMGLYVFKSCQSLARINFPENMKTIGMGMFYGCKSIVSVDFPNCLETIGSVSFSSTGLKHVVIPPSVTQINSDAFAFNEHLSSVEIPSDVKSIGYSAFANCAALKEVVYLSETPFILPDDEHIMHEMQVFSEPYPTLYALASAKEKYLAGEPWNKFENIVWCGVSLDMAQLELLRNTNETLTATAVIPSVRDNQNIIWTSSDTSIATVDEQGTVTAVAPGSATITASSAAYPILSASCNVTVTKDVAAGDEFDYNGLKYVILTMPQDGKYGTVSTKPGSYEMHFHEGTSGNPDATGDVVLPSSIEFKNMMFTVTEIGSYGFYRNEITSIIFPETLTAIGEGAFQECQKLKDIVIPSGVTAIQESTFALCQALTSVSLPEGLTVIDLYAFSNCTGLTSVNIPSTVTRLGAYAFSDCSGLTSIEIPAVATDFGHFVFGWCTNLTTVVYLTENPGECNSNMFHPQTEADGILYATASAKSEYMAIDPWKSFSHIVWCGIELDKSEVTVAGTEPETLNATATLPPTMAGTDITWESSDPMIATVNHNGEVTGINNGNALITAKCGPFSATCNVTVAMAAGIDDIFADGATTVDVYSVQGILVKRNASRDDLKTLAPGFYIIGGKKVLLRHH